MGHPTAEQIAQRAFDLGVLTERQVQQVWSELGTRNVRVRDLLKVLLRREFLTNYQAERLIKGDKSGFFYGEYKVLYLVGSGAFARVFRAVHRETDQVVALKVLRQRYSDNPQQYNLFLREGEVGITLRHPNIVPIYEVVSTAKNHFLVMEFVEGRNLREFVKIRGKLTPTESVSLANDIASGLQYAFENGLTHRDLKMSNVLVSSRGQAKLVDFGLAAMDEMLANDAQGDQPNARTIDYAALERATGVRRDDTRSDIYFLGCIFYHMLTGVAPLSESRGRVHRLNKTRFSRVTPIQRLDPTIPNSVAIVVNRAMALDPTKRYQSPADMAHDLRAAAKRLENEPQRVPPGSGKKAGTSPQAPAVPAEPEHTVMIVESNGNMQDVFRDGFRRAGYRVLLISDPGRAVERLQRDPAAADCIVFNAQEIGEPAVEGFNRLAENPDTDYIPCILLLDEHQRAWNKKARSGERHVVLPMPITLKRLRAEITQLIGIEAATQPAAEG